MESVNMATQLGISSPNIVNKSNNVLNVHIESDGEDDRFLDSVSEERIFDQTPQVAIFDDEDNEIPRAFCTRCRTISTSFLSSSFLPPTGDYFISGSPDSCNGLPPQAYIDDDVPLICDEDNGFDSGSVTQHSVMSEHCHTPKLSGKSSQKAITKLMIAAFLTFLFMLAEAVGGYFASSIAIMSDAAHLLSDLASFVVSLVAIYLSLRPASKKMSFGYYRAEVLGAVVSVLIIWVITGLLVYAAVERCVSMDFEVEADTMIIVSAIGVVMNIILGFVLHSGGHGHSHGGGHAHAHSHGGDIQNVNIRAAFIHVLGDLIQSVGVLIAAYIIRYYPQYKVADPICTFLFSVLVMCTTIPILRDLSHVLMEGTPPGIDYAGLVTHLGALPGVKMVHSLHPWALTMDKIAVSVHLAINADSDPELILRDAQRVLRLRHNIFHTTIQVEQYQPQLMDNCQQCQPLC